MGEYQDILEDEQSQTTAEEKKAKRKERKNYRRKIYRALVGDSEIPVGMKKVEELKVKSYEQREDFIQNYVELGVLSAAARKCKVPLYAFRALRERDKDFDQLWKEAEIAVGDMLEAECIRRATKGVKDPVYYRGEKVGYIRKYSDAMLMFLLKGHKPKKYKDRVMNEHTGKDGGPIETKAIFDGMTNEQLVSESQRLVNEAERITQEVSKVGRDKQETDPDTAGDS